MSSTPKHLTNRKTNGLTIYSQGGKNGNANEHHDHHHLSIWRYPMVDLEEN
jgi:hypothetical protein